MPSLPPELRVEIRKVGDQFLAVTERANGGEVCSHLFKHDPDLLVHIEPQWMLKRGARAGEDGQMTLTPALSLKGRGWARPRLKMSLAGEGRHSREDGE